MELQTKVKIPRYPFGIDHQSKLILLGSCFSDSIGQLLQRLKFDVCSNPFGAIYNPISLVNSIDILLTKEKYSLADLSEHEGTYFSFSHYSAYSDEDPNTCLHKINQSHTKAKQFIEESEILFVTLGTSWGYRLKSTNRVVNNCHKLPSKFFERFFSSAFNTYKELKGMVEKMIKANKDVKLIFTISPIRHVKDGLVENQRSKAALITAVHMLIEEFDSVSYFPVYEVFMDELRDYRYFAADMIHPSDVAIQYIWDLFQDSFFSPEAKSLTQKVDRLIKSIEHKPVNHTSLKYQQFIDNMLKNIKEIESQYKYMDFEKGYLT